MGKKKKQQGKGTHPIYIWVMRYAFIINMWIWLIFIPSIIINNIDL